MYIEDNLTEEDVRRIDQGRARRLGLDEEFMMRKFIEFKCPVRMGMGLGTFYDFEYSTNTAKGFRSSASPDSWERQCSMRMQQNNAAAKVCGSSSIRQ